MEIRLEAKTLAIGVLLGAIIVMVLGLNDNRDRATGRLLDTTATGIPGKADFGLSVASDGMALVRIENGDFFIVNPKSGMATRVLRARRLTDEPTRNRDGRGKVLNFSVAGPLEESETTGGYGK